LKKLCSIPFLEMLNNKRALPYDKGELSRPAKKRSFVGLGRGSQKNNVISMSSEYLSKIMTELKQGLYHIGEALSLATESGSDMFCMQPISDAQEFIKRFVRTTVAMPEHLINRRNAGLSNLGWSPMRSQFLGIRGLKEMSSERGRGRGRRRGRCRGRGRGRSTFRGRYNGYIQKPIVMNKSTKKAVSKYCEVCRVKCNSISQWEQHINGYTHRARLLGEEPPKRTKKTDVRREAKNLFEKFPVRNNDSSQRSSEEEINNPHKGRKYKKHSLDRRRSSGNRQPAGWLICHLCGTKCNGKIQYAGHINGKQHQLALERQEKKLTCNLEGEVGEF